VRIGRYHDTTLAAHTIEPPPRGSVCRIVTFPPDATFRGKVGVKEVEAFFRAMGSPGASTYSPQAPHPYMQKTRTLDFCLVLEGEIRLVLDTTEFISRLAIRWCSAVPITPGAIDRTASAGSLFPCTTGRHDRRHRNPDRGRTASCHRK
jgi:hypothetical protein